MTELVSNGNQKNDGGRERTDPSITEALGTLKVKLDVDGLMEDLIIKAVKEIRYNMIWGWILSNFGTSKLVIRRNIGVPRG